MKTTDSIGTYLIHRLYEHGVHHVFGVPGDFILGFDKLLEDSLIQLINTCDEQGAGFVADAYARLRGLGAESNPRVVNKSRSKLPSKNSFHRVTGTKCEHLNFFILNTA